MKTNLAPTHPPRSLNLVTPIQDLYLCDLMSTIGSQRYWNNFMLTNIENVDRHMLLKTYLSRNVSSDKIIWPYHYSGEYTVRSGYRLLTRDPTQIQLNSPPPHGQIPMKTPFGNYQYSQKLNISFWRVLSRALGTMTRLNTRGMNLYPTCNTPVLGIWWCMQRDLKELIWPLMSLKCTQLFSQRA